MIKFIKTHDLENIKKKMILIFALNIFDIILTLGLYSTRLFEEANFLMINVITKPTLALAIKAFVPGILLYWLHGRIQDATETQLKQSNFFLLTVTLWYAIVVVSQLFYAAFFPLFYSLI